MKNKGITLVALVITIIILLILAGITISQLTGSGLFENAKLAEQESKEAQNLEDNKLSQYENEINKWLNKEPEIEYDDFFIWISLAGIQVTNDNLEESEDSEIEKLFTSQEAIEYMINSNGELQERILNSEKMIGYLAKYEESKRAVLSNESWRTALHESNNVDVFYENASYNAEDGVAETNITSVYNNNTWESACLGNSFYPTSTQDMKDLYLQYNFSKPVNLYRFQVEGASASSQSQLGAEYAIVTIIIKGSNDGINYVPVSEELQIKLYNSSVSSKDRIQYFDINCNEKYSKYKIEFINGGILGNKVYVYGKGVVSFIDARFYTY